MPEHSSLQQIQKAVASCKDVLISLLEIAGVPRIGDVACRACELHHDHKVIGVEFIRVDLVRAVVILHLGENDSAFYGFFLWCSNCPRP